MRQRQPGVVVISIGLTLAGAWWIAIASGVPLMSLNRFWPVGLSIGGLALLVQRSLRDRQDMGLLLFGSVLLLTGLFLCLFAFRIGNLTWQDMTDYWPILLLIVGFAFVLVYLASDMREQALLVPVYFLGGIGLVALPITLGMVRGAISSQVLWLSPLLLVLIVLAVLMRSRRRVGQQTRDD